MLETAGQLAPGCWGSRVVIGLISLMPLIANRDSHDSAAKGRRQAANQHRQVPVGTLGSLGNDDGEARWHPSEIGIASFLPCVNLMHYPGTIYVHLCKHATTDARLPPASEVTS